MVPPRRILRGSVLERGAHMKTAIAVACGSFVLASLAPLVSAKPLPLEAPDPGRGVIGVTIKVIPPARMGSMAAVAVYFVRVVEDADRFRAESVINSNLSKGRNVYLLNAKPGRYVAVGCDVAMASGGGEGRVVFTKADILKTEVEVRAGSVVFMGDIDAQSSTKTGESDEAQAHYLPMIAPAAANKGFMTRALGGNFVYTAVFKDIVRDEAAAAEFWGDAIEKHFKNEPAWSSRIAGRSVVPPGGAPPTDSDVDTVREGVEKKDDTPQPGAIAARLQGNIPATRLQGGTYTSPDGAFELTLPPLINPGAKAEERQISEGQSGVFFADELGNMYYVIRTDNGQSRYDLEKVAAGYTVNEVVREKQIVPTARGSELRLAAVMPERSPIAQEIQVERKTVLKKLDLHESMSLFIAGAYLYEVVAGVTATHQETEAEMLARAKERLEAFLAGLRIRAVAAPGP